MPPALLVFSHLRWDFVFQRPQHLLSRLATHYRVYFFEEPVTGMPSPELKRVDVAPGVTVLRPQSPIDAQGFHDDQMPTLRELLREFVQSEGIDDATVWFYTPMATPLLQELRPRAIVYDCMDELSAFRHAPPQLLEREEFLLGTADVVFTGGPSLFRSKQHRHQAVYCFPSSVDAAHFGRLQGGGDHPEQAGLPRPRLGFCGVIDERLDIDLLASIADAHPAWQIVMVGPVVKIDPSILPRRSNIHYFGQRRYDELPQFLAGWDVCLLPFALNDSTRFISPTKTLEYMAAGKAVVSTPITDVAVPYGTVVDIGTGPAEFIAACEAALARTGEQRAQRCLAMREAVARTSWDGTVARMREILSRLPARGSLRRAAEAPTARGSTLPAHREPVTHQMVTHQTVTHQTVTHQTVTHQTIVVGAGPTGLSAAYHLGKRCLLLERESRVGGWCRSITDGGFTFDHAGHIMFSNDPYVHELYRLLLGDNVHWQDREAWIYSKGVHTRYPFQGALYGLPPDVLTDCIVGAIEARFGAVLGPDKAVGRSGSAASCKAESITDSAEDCCADGVVASGPGLAGNVATTADQSPAPGNFEEFIYRVWGRGVAQHFAIPYNRKLWTVPLSEMETSWLGGRVPMPDLREMIAGALQPVPAPMGPNARFGYPLRGGFQALMDGFIPHLQGELRVNADVARISPARHMVTLKDGSSYRYERLISTMPLPALIAAIGADAPEELHSAARGLRHVSVRCVNLGIARPRLTNKHWIYYPEDTVFHRIFVQGNASPLCNPPGGFGLTCEISYSQHKPLPCDGDALIERCIRDCIAVGMITPEDRVTVRNQVDMPYAYVIYDHARSEHVQRLRTWLLERDIILAGRYSEWEYYNSDHAFLAGRKAAETALAASSALTESTESCATLTATA